VRVAESFADGDATAKQLDLARREAIKGYQQSRVRVRGSVFGGTGRGYTGATYRAFGAGACLCAAGADPYASLEEPGDQPVLDWQDAADTAMDAGSKWHAELAAICGMLRDIFGNPFRAAAVDPAWLTPAVLALAQGIYDGRAFNRMPLLADALEAAGCDDATVLDHCRGAGPHVRGCWVVDRVLGKG